MKNTYQVAGHRFAVSGERLCKAVERIEGFKPFQVAEGEVLFTFVEGTDVPAMQQVQYEFAYEDVTGTFGRTEQGFMLTLKPEAEEPFHLWYQLEAKEVALCGNWSVRLYRFAMWVGLGLMLVPYGTVAIHSSCIVYKDKAVLFLGESGTGKSTHTRLWREHITGARLLNDDSPIVRFIDGKAIIYGSPWSGKTPCYKNLSYPIAAFCRLSQAPHNAISRLSTIAAIGAVLPSTPPQFAHDGSLQDSICSTLGELLRRVPAFHLACLPDAEAAQLSHKTMIHNA